MSVEVAALRPEPRRVLLDYPHRQAGHCGSGALRDLLEWAGLGWEPVVYVAPHDHGQEATDTDALIERPQCHVARSAVIAVRSVVWPLAIATTRS